MARKPAPPKPKPKHAAPKLTLEQRVKRDPALLERALRDPGLRSKLPDRYLNPAQRAQRKEVTFRRDIGDLSTPLSGDSLINTAEVLTDREFKPLEQDITRQEGAVGRRRDAQQGYAAKYYGGLAKQFDATLAGQQGANTAAVGAAEQRKAGTLGAIDTVAGQARERTAQDAAVRGADVQGDSLEQMAAAQAQQKMRAEQEGGAQADSARNFGQAQEAFLRGLSGATAQSGGEVQGQIAARGDDTLNDLASERAKLRTGRNGQFTDTLMKLRGGEVERTLTERGLSNDAEKAVLDAKLDMAKLRTEAEIQRANRDLKVRLTGMGITADAAKAMADRASRESIAQASNETSAANNAATNETSAANNAASNAQSDRNSRRAGGAGSFKPQDLRKAADDRDKALSLAQRYKNNRASRETTLQLLTEKYGDAFARLAVNVAYDAGRSNGHLQSLIKQRYGIDVPRQYRR